VTVLPRLTWVPATGASVTTCMAGTPGDCSMWAFATRPAADRRFIAASTVSPTTFGKTTTVDVVVGILVAVGCAAVRAMMPITSAATPTRSARTTKTSSVGGRLRSIPTIELYDPALCAEGETWAQAVRTP
jgi:hypothetical protein